MTAATTRCGASWRTRIAPQQPTRRESRGSRRDRTRARRRGRGRPPWDRDAGVCRAGERRKVARRSVASLGSRASRAGWPLQRSQTGRRHSHPSSSGRSGMPRGAHPSIVGLPRSASRATRGSATALPAPSARWPRRCRRHRPWRSAAETHLPRHYGCGRPYEPRRT